MLAIELAFGPIGNPLCFRLCCLLDWLPRLSRHREGFTAIEGCSMHCIESISLFSASQVAEAKPNGFSRRAPCCGPYCVPVFFVLVAVHDAEAWNVIFDPHAQIVAALAGVNAINVAVPFGADMLIASPKSVSRHPILRQHFNH